MVDSLNVSKRYRSWCGGPVNGICEPAYWRLWRGKNLPVGVSRHTGRAEWSRVRWKRRESSIRESDGVGKGVPVERVEPELVGPVHQLPVQSVLETGNSVGTLRRSLLVSRMLRASPTVPITNTLSPVKSNIFWASSNHSPEPNSESRNWRCQSK